MVDLRRQSNTLYALTWPIFAENLLRLMLGNVSVFMLSRYSESAVSAVGVANQLVYMAITVYSVISAGTGIIISQSLGAGKDKQAVRAAVAAISVNTAFGMLMSLALVLSAKQLLRMMKLPGELMDDACLYLGIVGGASFLHALMSVISSTVRSYGDTRNPMYIAFIMNVFNILGNCLVIYRPLNFPALGVKGIALSSVASQLLACCLMLLLLRGKLANVRLSDFIRIDFSLVKAITKTGIPAAAEILSYSVTQSVITGIIAMLGTEALTLRIYILNIVHFVSLTSLSIGQSAQILVGHLAGAGQTDEAVSVFNKSLKMSILTNSMVGLLVLVFYRPLLSIFTNNPSLVGQAGLIVLIDLVVEVARAFNHVGANSLRGAGDLRFTMVSSILSMWGIGVLQSYLLGIRLHMGLPGIWAAFAADECIRGLVLYMRWKSNVWRKMAVVKAEEHNAIACLCDGPPAGEAAAVAGTENG